MERIKKAFEFTLAILILVAALAIITLLLSVSTGLVDFNSEPVTDAEQNTTGVPRVSASEDPSIDGEELEMEIFETVNERRRALGREPFVHSERVRLISRIHSADMAERDFFNHTNPDGIAPPGRHEKYGGCESPNENIAAGGLVTTTKTDEIVQEIVTSWANSTGHNKSMMTTYDKVSGIGVHVTEDKDIYVTQNFCREHPNA